MQPMNLTSNNVLVCEMTLILFITKVKLATVCYRLTKIYDSNKRVSGFFNTSDFSNYYEYQHDHTTHFCKTMFVTLTEKKNEHIFMIAKSI